jgi:hypothetical protein
VRGGESEVGRNFLPEMGSVIKLLIKKYSILKAEWKNCSLNILLKNFIPDFLLPTK